MTQFEPYIVGQKIAQYTVIKQLAETQSSQVYLVNDTHFQKPLVLKLFSPKTKHEQTRSQFIEQANIVFALPNNIDVVGVMYIGECTDDAVSQHQVNNQNSDDTKLLHSRTHNNSRPFIVMPYYPQTLDKLLALHQQKLSFSSSLELIINLLTTLQKLHELGVLHLDIKPQNIFLDEASQPFLGDFDNAYIFNTSPLAGFVQSTTEASLVQSRLSLDYASPEQYKVQSAKERQEALSAKSDLFSLGVLWYRILQGEIPKGLLREEVTSEVTIEQAQNFAKQITVKLEEIAPTWAIQLILSMLQRAPQDRPNNAHYCLTYIKEHTEIPEDSQTIIVDSADISPKLKQLETQIEYILLHQGVVCARQLEHLRITYLSQVEPNYSVSDAANAFTAANTSVTHQNEELAQLITNIKVRLVQQNNLTAWFAWIDYLLALASKKSWRSRAKVSTKEYASLLQAGRGSRPDDLALIEEVLNKYVSVTANKSALLMRVGFSTIVIVAVFFYLYISTSGQSMSPATSVNKKPELATFTAKRELDLIQKNGIQDKVLLTNMEDVKNTHPMLEVKNAETGEYHLSYLININGQSQARTLSIPWVRLVNVPNTKIMATEVTNELYRLCEQDGGCRRSQRYSTSRQTETLWLPQHPKVNISWYDVHQQFVPWLNQKLDKTFSLPTFVQWQQITNVTMLNLNNKRVKNISHCNDCNHQYSTTYARETMPVTLIAPVANMYHVLGNVQEWLLECWQQEDLSMASKQQPSSSLLVRCDQAAVAGGSWIDKHSQLQNMPISQLLKTARTPTTGFRLVETIHVQ